MIELNDLRSAIGLLEQFELDVRTALEKRINEIDRRFINAHRDRLLRYKAHAITFTEYEIYSDRISFTDAPERDGDDERIYHIPLDIFFDEGVHQLNIAMRNEEETSEKRKRKNAATQAAQTKKQKREAKELAELQRLKAKYEK